MTKKYDISKELLIEEYFNRMKSQEEIAQKLGISQWVISQRMREFRLQPRERTWKIKEYAKLFDFDNKFFDEINEKNAWVLGWLLSDGFVQKYKKSTSFGIKVAKKDADIIYKLKDLLKFSGNIYNIEQKLKKTGKSYKQLMIKLNDKETVKKLERIGIVKNKTKTAKFLNVIKETNNETIIKAFIKGVFEGDGSILFEEKYNSLLFQIVGTKELLLDIQKYLIKYLDLRKTKLTQNIKNKNHFALRYRGNIQGMKIFNWLYEETEYYLDRKYNKYLEVKRRLEKCVA